MSMAGKVSEEFELPADTNFVKMEEKVLAYWRQIDAFGQQLERTKHNPPFIFYDGPPFATGTPHYGHVSVGTMKDVITRYASMNGHHCPRRFGWDCHGLPIEYEIDKALNITDRKAVYAMGVANYNDECRKIVMRYADDWKAVVERMGRWIDMDGAYRTTDLSYMESVWWVFKQVFDKGLVYQGCRVMSYSCKISTVLSNFEASLNYRDRQDMSVVVSFPLVAQPEVELLAWTTTPWSLPSNLALTVHPDLEYVKVRDAASGRIFVLARSRLREIYKSAAEEAGGGVKVARKLDRKKQAAKAKIGGKVEAPTASAPAAAEEARLEPAPRGEEEPVAEQPEFEVLESFRGRDMAGWEYVALFDFYEAKMRPRGCFRVYTGEHVEATAGTGIVHTSPAYGEEDYQVALRNKIIEAADPCDALDENGVYLPEVSPWAGKFIFDANPLIVERLAADRRLVKKEVITHSYPMCWRSNTPLIYRAVKTWFIRASAVREQMVANNAKTRWVPSRLQKRFHEWVEKAEDWCFSRSRFWGNPIPLWVSADGEEVVCVGSLAELRERAGLPPDHPLPDMHREHIDGITIPSRQGKGALRRVEEVFDCWFESGAMPYAHAGLPQQTPLADFPRAFPAHFIGEGSDQIRGWFYTLNVLSAILFNETPYRNIVVTGMIVDRAGEKLSKSKKNYTDPLELVAREGADALRLYFMNSPIVRAEELRFKDEELTEVVKRTFIPWLNLCRLLAQEAARQGRATGAAFVHDEGLFAAEGAGAFADVADRWILAQLERLVGFVRQEVEAYRLYTVAAEQLRFLDALGNWFVKLNKARMKGEDGEAAARLALDVLLHCLLRLMTLMAPFVPFLTEHFYLGLRRHLRPDSPLRADSIHFLQLPAPTRRFLQPELVAAFQVFQALVTSVRKRREQRRLNLKQPLPRLTVVPRTAATRAQLELLREHLAAETNVLDVEIVSEARHADYVEFVLEPDHRALGEKYKARYNEIKKLVLKPAPELTAAFARDRSVTARIVFEGAEEAHVLGEQFFALRPRLRPQAPQEHVVVEGEADFAYELDVQVNDELKLRGLAREMVNRVQKHRKALKLQVTDAVYVVLRFPDSASALRRAFAAQREAMAAKLKKPLLEAGEVVVRGSLGAAEFAVEGETLCVDVVPRTYVWDAQKLSQLLETDDVQDFVAQVDEALGPAEKFGAAGVHEIDAKHKDKTVKLVLGEHFTLP